MCKIRALEKIIICITSNVLQDLRDNRSISTLAAYHLMLIIDSNLSSPLIFPSFKTKIFSQSFIVFKRWPIVMTVDSFSLSRTTFQIVCSVSGSTCAVGSSKTTILLRCSSTRAKQINCRSPTLTLAPCSSSS